MTRKSKFDRRFFVKFCASAVAMIGANPRLLANPDATLHRYQRSRLVDHQGKPITPDHLKIGENYLFRYPFIATPCFLLNLGKATEKNTVLQTEHGATYRWQGGVGPKRSIVAFSAICAHKMSYPANEVSFINYRHRSVSFLDQQKAVTQRAQVIHCCSERSVYDPLRGASVLGGPAPQPLAAIELEYDKKDGSIYAIGVSGGELFEAFYQKYFFRLTMEFKTQNVKQAVAQTTEVVPLTGYSHNQVLC